MNSSLREYPVLTDLTVGQQWRSSGRTLTETDLSYACMTSGDWHPIHADAVYAAGTPLGQRIFQGTYGLHVAFGMATPFPPLGNSVIAALGLHDWAFEAPLFVGDTIYVEVEITGLRPTSDGQRIVLEKRIRLIRDDGQVLQQGLARSLMRINKSPASKESGA